MINMFGVVRFPRWLLVAVILATGLTASLEAHAQFFWDQQYQYKRSRPQSGGFYRNFFEPFNSHPRRQLQQQHAQPAESSRAPSPRKAESKAAPTTSIVVMGDDMADWLAYGLEDVLADSPEIGIVRKNKLSSGLLRYEGKGDLDLWHVARDTLAQEKADYVIMMLGVGDRQDIGERDLAKEADAKAKDQKDQQAKDETDKKSGQKPAKPDSPAKAENPEEVATAQRIRKAGVVAEFRGDDWAKIYSRRIDETIAR